MSFLIEESIDTNALTVGDMVNLTWRIPYDRPNADVTFDLSPGPTLTGGDLQKNNIGSTAEWDGRTTYEYRAERVELEATFTEIDAETDGAKHADSVTAEPALT